MRMMQVPYANMRVPGVPRIQAYRYPAPAERPSPNVPDVPAALHYDIKWVLDAACPCSLVTAAEKMGMFNWFTAVTATSSMRRAPGAQRALHCSTPSAAVTAAAISRSPPRHLRWPLSLPPPADVGAPHQRRFPRDNRTLAQQQEHAVFMPDRVKAYLETGADDAHPLLGEKTVKKGSVGNKVQEPLQSITLYHRQKS
jgi:hypothetical protein